MPREMQSSEESRDLNSYRRTQMQRELVIQKLKEQGCRITRQRRMLLDIILEEECSCSKEIYYKAMKTDPKIGKATVYRMVHVLEEIGAISRKNMYRIACDELGEAKHVCRIELDDGTVCWLSERKWDAVVQAGMKACGYMKNQRIQNIVVGREGEPAAVEGLKG